MQDNCFFFHPSWPVLYEDNHLLGLYKPAGLLVQADETREISLLELGKLWIKDRYGKPGQVFLGMVHRLDRPVAGVVLFCRTSKAAGRLSEQFRTGRTKKRYLAVVEGVVTRESGRLIDQIERLEGRSSRIVERATQRSQEARLSYRLIGSKGSRSLLEIDLETGRHHQIRVQLSHAGHPIVGDLRYGASKPLPKKQIALLARDLTFEHPTRKEEMTLWSPRPDGWPWEDEGAPGAPAAPWNWTDLAASIRLPHDAPGPCSFPDSVEE